MEFEEARLASMKSRIRFQKRIASRIITLAMISITIIAILILIIWSVRFDLGNKILMKYKYITFNKYVYDNSQRTVQSYISTKIQASEKYEFEKCIDCNVILIVLDGFRPDHLGIFGYFRNTSANIDILAKKGVVFSNAYSQDTWTLPSHVTIFTSLYPSVHGKVLSAYPFTTEPILSNRMSNILHNNGYNTINLGWDTNLRYHFFCDGFDICIKNTSSHSQEIPLEDIYGNISKLIRLNKRDKFLMFIHSYDAFSKKAYNTELFDKNNTKIYDEAIEPLEGASRNVPPYDNIGAMKHYIAHYDNGIFFADEVIGKLWDMLSDEGINNRTIIVIISDHGNEFYENSIYNIGHHTGSLYEESIRVVFILYNPKSNEKGLVVDKPVGLIDILPTILDITNVTTSEQFQGNSVIPLINNENCSHDFVLSEAYDEKRGELTHMESLSCDKCDNILAKATDIQGNIIRRMVRVGEWKFILNYKSKDELYNLNEDPYEHNNLISINIDKAEEIRELIENIVKYNQEARSRLWASYSQQRKSKGAGLEIEQLNKALRGFEVVDTSFSVSSLYAYDTNILDKINNVIVAASTDLPNKVFVKIITIENITREEYEEIFTSQKMQMDFMYERTTTGYPGAITKEVTCAEEFLPVYKKDENENIISDSVLFYGSSRLTSGVCSWDIVGSRIINSLVFDKNKKAMIIIESYILFNYKKEDNPSIDDLLLKTSSLLSSNLLELL